MDKTKVAIYNCYVPYNNEVAEETKQKLIEIQKQIESDLSVEFIGVFEDSCPAKTPMNDRPELTKLLELAEKREIDEILVPQVKRLSTRVELMIDIFNQFDKNNVKIKCLEEGLNSRSIYTKTALQVILLGMKQLTADPQKDKTKNVLLYYAYEPCCPNCEAEHQRRIAECQKEIEADEELNLVGTITDMGIDDEPITERKGIKILLEECRKEDVEMIYTHSIESLAPLTQDFIEICQELEEIGVGIKFMDSELTMQCDEETDFAMTMM